MNIHAIAKQIRSFTDELEAAKTEQPDPYAELKKGIAEGEGDSNKRVWGLE